MFENLREAWLETVHETGVTFSRRARDAWDGACFEQIWVEGFRQPDSLRRAILHNWLRRVIPLQDRADAVNHELARVGTVTLLEPREQALTCLDAVRTHCKRLNFGVPVPDKVRWVSLQQARWAEVHPAWRARYVATQAWIHEPETEVLHALKLLCFAILARSSADRRAGIKHVRPAFTAAVWEAATGVEGPWRALMDVVVRGYWPVGVAPDGRAFLVSGVQTP